MEGQDTRDSDSYEENSKNICLYAHIPMYAGLRSKAVYTHEYGFKVVYRYKQVIFGDDIGTSKYNISPWGPKSLQRDMKGHKYVINQVW